MTGLVLLLAAALTGGQEPIFGTDEPFASEAIYFVVTDRFVDGDPANNHPAQGGDAGTFDEPWHDADGNVIANLGYLGGDFRGLLDHAGYIAEMGFTAVWITPIVANPDEAFLGSHTPDQGMFADHRKSGYHGYWGVNFFEEDEHLVSEGLRFADLTRRLRDEHGLKLVLDIVGNHGSPSWGMPHDQPGYGEVYDRNGELVADHQNLHPTELDPDNPLHQWFHREPDLATLSNFDDTNPAVIDYLVAAHGMRIEEGAAAFRIDTIRHMPHAFWKTFADRIRARHPGFFMFGEHFSYEAADIAQHMKPENGSISVLDFPGRAAMERVFGKERAGFETLLGYLHLDDGVYQNPYELMTFYDNHDMPRMDADLFGFIDAHNWLFTSRGIPVIYYGSEIGFRAGRAEHAGNRDYFGTEGIEQAREHRIRQALSQIANLRKRSPALQRGLQVNLDVAGEQASFLRVYQRDGVQQTALVVLNKGDAPGSVAIDGRVPSGEWLDGLSGESVTISAGSTRLTVPAHGVRVLLNDGPALLAQLDSNKTGN